MAAAAAAAAAGFAAAAVAAQAEVHAVLTVCGIISPQDRQRIVMNEGFNTLEDFAVMDGDQDVVDMAKRLAGRPAASRVNLGTVQIKALQALIWWIHDRQTHGQPLVAADWDQAAMTAARVHKRIEKERPTLEATVSGLTRHCRLKSLAGNCLEGNCLEAIQLRWRSLLNCESEYRYHFWLDAPGWCVD